MAHFTGQQRLVFECLVKLGIRLLAFDRNAEQAGEAGEEIGIGLVELTCIGAVDFKDTEVGLALAPFRSAR